MTCWGINFDWMADLRSSQAILGLAASEESTSFALPGSSRSQLLVQGSFHFRMRELKR